MEKVPQPYGLARAWSRQRNLSGGPWGAAGLKPSREPILLLPQHLPEFIV
jgi:hypothetical protein